MNKSLIVLTIAWSFSLIYCSEAPTKAVALPVEPASENADNWGHEEFNSILPDHLIHLINTAVLFHNAVVENKLSTQTRMIDPATQRQAIEGMLLQRNLIKGSAEYHMFIDNWVDQYNEQIADNVKRLEKAQEGFVDVTSSMVKLAEREQQNYQEALDRYRKLPLSTKVQRSVDSAANQLWQALNSNVNSEIRKKFDDILRDLRLLKVQNPEEMITNALRSGVLGALNMLQMMINQAKLQMQAERARLIEKEK